MNGPHFCNGSSFELQGEGGGKPTDDSYHQDQEHIYFLNILWVNTLCRINSYRAVVRPGTNSLAFIMYVNKALLQFILQKLLSSNVDIFWSLLLFESAVRSLGVLPRVFSILELHKNT